MASGEAHLLTYQKTACRGQALAAWRETTAQRRDVPRRWVLTDEVIVEIARRVPTTPAELLEVRGLRERLTDRSVQEILMRIDLELSADPDTWPKMKKKSSSSRDVESAVDLLQALLHLRAKQQGVATQFIASRDDLVKLAKGKGRTSRSCKVGVATWWARSLLTCFRAI